MKYYIEHDMLPDRWNVKFADSNGVLVLVCRAESREFAERIANLLMEADLANNF